MYGMHSINMQKWSIVKNGCVAPDGHVKADADHAVCTVSCSQKRVVGKVIIGACADVIPDIGRVSSIGTMVHRIEPLYSTARVSPCSCLTSRYLGLCHPSQGNCAATGQTESRHLMGDIEFGNLGLSACPTSDASLDMRYLPNSLQAQLPTGRELPTSGGTLPI